MVIALLVCLAATVATGIVAYGEQGKGPLAAAQVTGTTNATGSEARRIPIEEGGSARKASSPKCMTCWLTSLWRWWSRTSWGWR